MMWVIYGIAVYDWPLAVHYSAHNKPELCINHWQRAADTTANNTAANIENQGDALPLKIKLTAVMFLRFIADAAITNAQINDLSADKINAGSIRASVMQATSVYADKLEGDVNTLRAFRDTSPQSFAGGRLIQERTVVYLRFLSYSYQPALTQMGTYRTRRRQAGSTQQATRLYTIKMLMRDNSTTSCKPWHSISCWYSVWW